MKFFVIAVAFCLLVGVQALTEEQKMKVREYFKICQEHTGVDHESLGRVRKFDFDFEDEKVKDWFTCMFKRTGVMNDDGKFQKHAALTKVEPEIREKVAKAIDSCVDLKLKKPNEYAWKFAQCYHKERPDHQLI